MEDNLGPFKLLDVHNADCENQPDPIRKYDCDHYSTCLSLAAALDWDSFHCSKCSGQVSEKLLWQARQLEKRDKLVEKICNFKEESTTPHLEWKSSKKALV